jgi:hypothetical protein
MSPSGQDWCPGRCVAGLHPSPPAVIALTEAGHTAAPDMVGVERVPGTDTLWDFRFDRAVTSARADGFVLYRRDGHPEQASTVVRPSPDVVRALVPDTDDAAEQHVLAAALPGAALGLDSTSTPSTLGTSAVGDFMRAPGRTTGPDLLAASLDVQGRLLTLTFDEPVDDDVPIDPSQFQFVLADGRRAALQHHVETRGGDVLFLARSGSEVPARIVVSRHAVRGMAGASSPPGSVDVAVPGQ